MPQRYFNLLSYSCCVSQFPRMKLFDAQEMRSMPEPKTERTKENEHYIRLLARLQKSLSCTMFFSFHFNILCVFQEQLKEAPFRQFQLEFAIPEGKFLKDIERGEATVADMQKQLDRGADVKDILKKYKVRLTVPWQKELLEMHHLRCASSLLLQW